MLPYYHLVSDEDLVHVRHLFRYRDVSTFNEDLDFLLRHYDPVSLDDVIAAVSHGTKLTRHSFLLTFDDGFREIHDVVAPMLVARGIPAVFFLNTSFLDNRALFFRCKASILAESVIDAGSPIVEKIAQELRSEGLQATGDDVRKGILSVDFPRRHVLDRIAELLDVDFQEFLSEQRPYLTSDQVRSLQDEGFHIGAHSADHPLYADLDLTGQLSQTFDSLEAIARIFHPTHTLFSFPFSDVGVPEAVFRAMYGTSHRGIGDVTRSHPVVDLSFGTSEMKQDTFDRHFHRFWMERTNEGANGIVKRVLLKTVIRSLLRRQRVHRG